jgi:hypothetical protein
MFWLFKPPTARRPLRIGIIGDSGSGKSTLVRAFLRAVGDPRAPRIDVQPVFEPDASVGEAGDDAGVTEEMLVFFRGEVRCGTGRFDLEVIDSNGLLLREPLPGSDASEEDLPVLYQATRKCDLLILVLAPRTLQCESECALVLGHLVSHVRQMLRHNPEGRVAIAYTKADEYGVPATATPRVVGDEPAVTAALEAFRSAAGADLHRRWSEFLDAVVATGDPDPGWRQTRRLLLERSRYLWESVVHQDRLGHAPLNGYFVAARPRFPHGSEPACGPGRGSLFLPLFADFFDQVKRRHGRPVWGWGSVAALGGLALFVFLAGLHSRGQEQALADFAARVRDGGIPTSAERLPAPATDYLLHRRINDRYAALAAAWRDAHHGSDQPFQEMLRSRKHWLSYQELAGSLTEPERARLPRLEGRAADALDLFQDLEKTMASLEAAVAAALGTGEALLAPAADDLLPWLERLEALDRRVQEIDRRARSEGERLGRLAYLEGSTPLDAGRFCLVRDGLIASWRGGVRTEFGALEGRLARSLADRLNSSDAPQKYAAHLRTRDEGALTFFRRLDPKLTPNPQGVTR